MIRECSDPVRNEVILRKTYIRITARDHLWHIAVSDSEATWKMLHLSGKDRLRCSLSDQCLHSGTVATTRSRFDRICLGNSRTGPCNVGETMDSERIAFANNEGAATILRKAARLRLDNAELEQLLQWRASAHDDIRVVAGGAGHVDSQVPKHNRARIDHLNDDRLRQGYKNDVVEVEIGILRLRFGPGRKGAENIIAVQDHEVIAFGEDHYACRCSEATDNVRHRICMSGERVNVGRHFWHNRPHKRLKRHLCGRNRLCDRSW